MAFAHANVLEQRPAQVEHKSLHAGIVAVFQLRALDLSGVELWTGVVARPFLRIIFEKKFRTHRP